MTFDDIKKFVNLEISDIDRVYNGKSGCGCGCLGTYSETDRSKKLQLTKFKKRLDEVECQDGKIFHIRTETRYHWMYLKEA